MKFCIALYCCLLLITLACASNTSGYDGAPGCKTQLEIGKLWRNFWDPMRYWRCVGLGMAALPERCADGTAFLQSVARCVPWIDWKWEPAKNPPSCPDGVVCPSADPLPYEYIAQPI